MRNKCRVSKKKRIPSSLPQDTNRQATLRDLEYLFEKRNAFKLTADQRLGVFDETKPLVPAFITETSGDAESRIPSQAYQTWMVRPRASLHLRLDRTFDTDVRNAIGASFTDTGLGNFYPPMMAGDSHIIRWQTKVSSDRMGILVAVRAIQLMSDGSIRFAEKIDRHEDGGESISDLFIQSHRFLRFVKDFYMNHGYSGSMSIAQRVDCSSPVDFWPNFPDTNGNYHSTNVIAFIGREKGRASGSSRISREVDLQTDDPETLICDFMLAHLRQLCHANVDYKGLDDLVRRLPSDVRGLAFF
jgi:hypothetical protein